MSFMKTTKKRWIAAVAAAAALFLVTASAFADTTEPGTESDPVVTKSYVDAKIAELKNNASNPGTPSAAGFQAIQLEAGQQMLGKEGTQIILRSGEATAIGNASNGVSDLTAGKDLMSGAPLNENHLLLMPREDGRGIKAGTIVWVMVSGGYTIQ